MINDIKDNTKDVTFQVSEWDYYHEERSDDLKKYVIRMYGTTQDEKKVFVKVNNFTPYFYVEIPKEWKAEFQVKILMETIKNEVGKSKTPELKDSLKEYELVDRHKFEEFNNYEMFSFVRLIFYSHEGFRAFERVFNRPINNVILHRKPKKYKVYESNIEPFLRCMHIRKLNSVGWIKIKGNRYNYFSEEDDISHNEISVYTDWTNLEHVENDSIAKFTIASFDLECTSGDGSFPQPERDDDKIIQIGTTFSKYGESECYYKHIITLGSCDKIEGATVESYNNESNVLLAWTKMIRKMNPDVITGYNIFGFDFNYLYKRSKKLGCFTSFSKLGRIRELASPFIEKTLTSSALGENKLTYYAMHGRINIDVMKVVMRDHKLASYKLDNVAAEFIRESVLEVEFNDSKTQTVIKTDNTYGLEVGRYVKIYFNDGLSDNAYKNEAKFKVLDVTSKSVTINGFLDEEAVDFDKYKIFWCQAKDDVSPADIFRMQKGTSKDRAIVASYCLQDASLINKLINKLQILTNNISMANVCHVPLSYIFLRGQGIKIFSLVAKKCRERNHVIPVIRKPFKVDQSKLPPHLIKKEEEEHEEEDEGYEGATVFEPTTGVHYEPITVKDYNSLYPNSMIYGNYSHECLVKNDKDYGNLSGYSYKSVTYSNKDGSTTTCKYAKSLSGPVGILPEILMDLLNARAQTRKLQAQEQDPFKEKILDGKQLALKITANSLYGQTGASTSPICNKDIAASTTATGRCMLNAARIFTEVIFKMITDSVLASDDVTYRQQMDSLFDKKIDELIGQKNIMKLKQLVEGEVVPRYDYLKVFTENQDEINDKKFIDAKANINTKNEYIDWFYKEVKKALEGKNIVPQVIYGDTDSIFIKFNIKYNGGLENLTDDAALKTSIRLGQLSSGLLFKVLPSPQNMLYEKTMWPLILLSKKRYVGNKYTFKPDEYEQLSMGIVLKRRDNAPIVKIIIGGIVRSVLNERDSKKALGFAKSTLKSILSGKYSMDKFIISKTLKGNALTKEEQKIEKSKPSDQRVYSDRTRIVHAVLADRMAERDPGNKPSSNERIPYAYVIPDGKVTLQGERVEHPEYIVEKNLPLDYLFYITNQIMKPAIQFLEHIVDNPNDIFRQCIVKEMNRRTGRRPLSYYFELLNSLENNIVHDDKVMDIKEIRETFFRDNYDDEQMEDATPKKTKKPNKKIKKVRDNTKSFTINDDFN